jgi:hypothetical protein
MKSKEKTLFIKRAREEKQWRQSVPAFLVLAKEGLVDAGMIRNIEAR